MLRTSTLITKQQINRRSTQRKNTKVKDHTMKIIKLKSSTSKFYKTHLHLSKNWASNMYWI